MAATNKSLAQNNKSRTGLRRPTSDRQRGAIPLALPTGGVPVAGSQRCWSFTALRDRRKLNMSWHHSDLYFFLCLLTGLATFLAITYECIQRFRRKPPVVELSRSTVGNPPSAPKLPPSRFSRLCESVKDLPPKEQASRLRDYFGIFGGVPPAEGRDQSGKGPAAYTPALNKLRNRFRRRFTPGEIQRLEQRSRTRL
jgi:hypothetical protein